MNSREVTWNARGTFCLLDRDGSGRSLSGVMVLNMAAVLSVNGMPDMNQEAIFVNQRTVLHELTHAMVFHPSLYSNDEGGMSTSYRDPWMNRRFDYNQKVTRSTPLDDEELP